MQIIVCIKLDSVQGGDPPAPRRRVVAEECGYRAGEGSFELDQGSGLVGYQVWWVIQGIDLCSNIDKSMIYLLLVVYGTSNHVR